MQGLLAGRMQGLLAIRKDWGFLEAHSGASTEETRADLALSLLRATEPHLDALQSIGFHAVAPPLATGPGTLDPYPTPGDGERTSPGDDPAMSSLDFLGCYTVHSNDGHLLEDARGVLDDDYYVVPDIPLSIPGSPPGSVKTALGEAAAGHVLGNWPTQSGVHDARAQANFGRGTVVGVLDTGCDADHAEFAQRIVEFAAVPLSPRNQVREIRGFDPHGHGTHVAGIVGGERSGIAPEADLLVAGVIESETVETSLSRILRGLDWMLRRLTSADHRGKPAVVSMSLGFPPRLLADPDMNGVMLFIRQLLTTLVGLDVLPVVAIGNDGPDTVRAPGYFPECLAVGAVDHDLQPANFSGGGMGPPPFDARSCPDVVGFGVEILSAYERHSDGTSWYLSQSGTSMATPYASAIASLVAARTGLRGAQLRNHLVDSALPLQHPPARVGSGLVRYEVA